MSHDLDPLVEVGRIVRAHGIRGEVKISPLVADPNVFFEWDQLTVDRAAHPGGARAIESVRLQPSKRGPLLIVKLSGVDTREDAEALRGAAVRIPRAEAPRDFVEGEELIGATVFDEGDREIGKVTDYIVRPPQNLLVVRATDGHEVLVPHVSALVPLADSQAGRVVVRPIEGLFE
jgi:16S rRNA processing protein RimM